MKKLTDFLNMLAESELRAGDNSDSADFDIPIKDITYNSLEAGEGTLFICKGAGFKEEYLKDALAKGAAAFVCEMGSKVHEACKADAELAAVPYIVVNNMRRAISKISAFFFDRSRTRRGAHRRHGFGHAVGLRLKVCKNLAGFAQHFQNAGGLRIGNDPRARFDFHQKFFGNAALFGQLLVTPTGAQAFLLDCIAKT